MPDWQIDSPRAAPVACFLFAHGAGAPMDSEFMLAISTGLAAKNIEVVRFEFPYMAARRVDGIRRPPDKLELLLRCYREQIDRFVSERSRVPLYIGGKSLGGRMASMLAQEYFALGNVWPGWYAWAIPSTPEASRTNCAPNTCIG
jgi:predicted alpha/beta-hydrolase family hydrolase